MCTAPWGRSEGSSRNERRAPPRPHARGARPARARGRGRAAPARAALGRLSRAPARQARGAALRPRAAARLVGAAGAHRARDGSRHGAAAVHAPAGRAAAGPDPGRARRGGHRRAARAARALPRGRAPRPARGAGRDPPARRRTLAGGLMRPVAALLTLVAAPATPPRAADPPSERLDAQMLLDLELLREADPARHRDQSLAE